MFYFILYYIKVVSTHHVSNQFLQYISIKIGLMPEVNGSKANSGASYPERKNAFGKYSHMQPYTESNIEGQRSTVLELTLKPGNSN